MVEGDGGDEVVADVGADDVVEEVGVDEAEVAVDAVFDAMRMSMQRGERIELRGFGVFQVKPRKRGIGRNPRFTGAGNGASIGRALRVSQAFHELLLEFR